MEYEKITYKYNERTSYFSQYERGYQNDYLQIIKRVIGINLTLERYSYFTYGCENRMEIPDALYKFSGNIEMRILFEKHICKLSKYADIKFVCVKQYGCISEYSEKFDNLEIVNQIHKDTFGLVHINKFKQLDNSIKSLYNCFLINISTLTVIYNFRDKFMLKENYNFFDISEKINFFKEFLKSKLSIGKIKLLESLNQSIILELNQIYFNLEEQYKFLKKWQLKEK